MLVYIYHLLLKNVKKIIIKTKIKLKKQKVDLKLINLIYLIYLN